MNLGYYRGLIKTCHDLADCAAKSLHNTVDSVPFDDPKDQTFQYWIRRRDSYLSEYVDLLIKARNQ